MYRFSLFHCLSLFLGGLPCSCCMSLFYCQQFGVYKLFQWRNVSPLHSFHHSSNQSFDSPACLTHQIPHGFMSFILEVIFVTLSSSSSFCWPFIRETCPNRSFDCTLSVLSIAWRHASFINSNCFNMSVLIVNLSQGICLLSYVSLSLSLSPPLSQVSVWPNCWRGVVVLHSDHHFILHSQFGCFPDCGKDGLAYRERRRPGQADWDRLRNARLRFHQRVLQGKTAIEMFYQMQYHRHF